MASQPDLFHLRMGQDGRPTLEPIMPPAVTAEDWSAWKSKLPFPIDLGLREPFSAAFDAKRRCARCGKTGDELAVLGQA